MSGNVYSAEEIKYRLTDVFAGNQVRRALLFGSYAKNTATAQSDVDLLLDTGLKGLAFVGLIEEIRRCLDKNVDVFDVTHIEEDSRIYHEIQKDGIVIYGE